MRAVSKRGDNNPSRPPLNFRDILTPDEKTPSAAKKKVLVGWPVRSPLPSFTPELLPNPWEFMIFGRQLAGGDTDPLVLGEGEVTTSTLLFPG
jgi:hypothetical protein